MVFRTQAGVSAASSVALGSIGGSISSGLAAVQQAQQQASALRAAQAAASAGAVLGASNTHQQVVNQTINNSTTIVDTVSDGVLGFLGSQIANLTNQVQERVSTPSELANLVASVTGGIIRGEVDNAANQVTGPINNLISQLGVIKNQGFQLVREESQNIRSFVASGINSGLSIVKRVIDIATQLGLKGLKSVVNVGNGLAGFVRDTGNRVGNLVKTTVGDALGVFNNTIGSAANRINDGVRDIFIDGKRFIQDRVIGLSRKTDEIIRDITSRIDLFKGELFNKVSRSFEIAKVFIDGKFDDFMVFMGELISRVIQTVMIGITASRDNLIPLFSQLTTIFEKLVTNRYSNFNEIQDDLSRAGDASGPIGIVLIGLVSAVGFFPVLFGMAQPFAENIKTLSMEIARPILLSPEDSAAAFYRGLFNQEDYSTELRKNGLSDERIQVIKEVQRPLLGARDIQFNFLRGNITEQQHDMSLSEYGFTDERIALIKQLYHVIPGIQDLITMSVREVFTPEIAREFGQFDDFPEPIVEWGEKQGLSREWLERYWAAHWALPSPNQGFEMLHRRIIDEDKLKLLLRALDVMPGWRDEMVALSYNPVTRVDVRRIYRLGIFDRNEVYDAYLDLGYSPEKAEIMTQFTVLNESPKPSPELVKLRKTIIDVTTDNYFEQRISYDLASEAMSNLGMNTEEINALLSVEELKRQHVLQGEGRVANAVRVRKMVLRAYENRAMSYDDSLTSLRNIGMADSQIEIDLNDIDLQVTRKVKQVIADKVQKLYLEYTISVTDVHTILGASGFVSDEIDLMLSQMDMIRKLGDRKPTRTDLAKFLSQGIIDMSQFENEIRGLGYNEKYVKWIVQSKNMEIKN